MKAKLFIIILLFSLTGKISAQSDQKAEIKKVIEYFFKGLQSGDTTIVKQTLIEKPRLQTTAVNKEGKTVLITTDYAKFLKGLAGKKPEDKWVEKLLSYNIQVDGNMANAWTPYEFYLNNDFSHCGVNSFQLISYKGVWKIVYLIDTRRKNNCKK